MYKVGKVILRGMFWNRQNGRRQLAIFFFFCTAARVDAYVEKKGMRGAANMIIDSGAW